MLSWVQDVWRRGNPYKGVITAADGHTSRPLQEMRQPGQRRHVGKHTRAAPSFAGVHTPSSSASHGHRVNPHTAHRPLQVQHRHLLPPQGKSSPGQVRQTVKRVYRSLETVPGGALKLDAWGDRVSENQTGCDGRRRQSLPHCCRRSLQAFSAGTY